MPFYGPLSLGSQNDRDSVSMFADQLRQKLPGATGLTMFPGQMAGTTSGIGFSHPGPVLYRGQPLSSSDTITNAAPITGGSGIAYPESITAFLNGIAAPAIPVVSQAARLAPPPVTGQSGLYSQPGVMGASPGETGPGAGQGMPAVADTTDPNDPGIGQGVAGALNAAPSTSPVTAAGQGALNSIGIGIPGTGIGISAGPAPTGAAGTGNTIGQIAGHAASIGLGIPGLSVVGGALGSGIGQLTANLNSEADINAMGTVSSNVGNVPSATPTVAQGEGGAISTAGPAGTPGIGDTAGPAGATGVSGGGAPTGGELSVGEGEGDGGGGGGAGGDGGGTVICGEIYRRGWMTEETYVADVKFGQKVGHLAQAGYQYWAVPVVRLMQKSDLVAGIVYYLALPWINYMSHEMGLRSKPSLLGKIITKVGVPLCRLIGSLVIKPCKA